MRLVPPEDVIKSIDIYVIISQISDEFYVWKTKNPNAYQAYKDHVSKKFKATKILFERSEEERNFPQMYLLETIQASEETAYMHCIAWTKYFIEQGMQPLSSKQILERTNNLSTTASKFFESIKDTPMEEILAPKRAVVADYKRKFPDEIREPKDQIRITVSEKEYEEIQRKAEKYGLSLSCYCRNMALDGEILVPDVDDTTWEYTLRVREAKYLLRVVLLAVYQNKRYFPADMENIERAVNQIIEVEYDLCKHLEENTEKLKAIGRKRKAWRRSAKRNKKLT